MFQNQEQRVPQEVAVPTEWNTMSIQVRRTQRCTCWIRPQDREVPADHKRSSVSVGAMGPKPGWERQGGKALETTWGDASKFGTEWNREIGQ